MDESKAAGPYKRLGRRLKELRSRARETLAEASGAEEIDVKALASFELGRSRPTEDVLLLLLSHFGAKDDEALKLWEIAGYRADRLPVAHMASDNYADNESQSTSEQRILFTDIVDIVVNNYGVVMNFMQNSGSAKTPVKVARVGMSREHAKSILQILQATLSQTERNVQQTSNRLAAPDNSSSDPSANTSSP